MQTFDLTSRGGGRLSCRGWKPAGKPVGVVQLVHGISEHAGRYDDFAQFLTSQGFVVTAEDHMGHGNSIDETTPLGVFSGGWSAAVDDVHRLYKAAADTYPNIPYFLFGHSMGSFLVRSFLIDYPDAGLTGAILSGTAWKSDLALALGVALCRVEIGLRGERGISNLIYNMAFGSYGKRFAPNRTSCDWLSRDEAVVDAYCADPLCGFVPSVGLLRDMMDGMVYNQRPENLAKMKKSLPVYFLSGAEDPVGAAGAGVRQSEAAFRAAGMENITLRLYPGGRHEMLNELNRDAVYAAVLDWMRGRMRDACRNARSGLSEAGGAVAV